MSRTWSLVRFPTGLLPLTTTATQYEPITLSFNSTLRSCANACSSLLGKREAAAISHWSAINAPILPRPFRLQVKTGRRMTLLVFTNQAWGQLFPDRVRTADDHGGH